MLPFVALLMPVLLGLAAFAIDLPAGWFTQRRAQEAADAAALAGAMDLPGNPSQAKTDAQKYLNENLSGASGTYTTPYNSNSSQIQVTVSTTSPSFFAQVLGIGSVHVSASAVATEKTGGGNEAVFSYDSSCTGSGLTIDTDNVTINGATASNGVLNVGGNSNSLGYTSYGGPNGCKFTQGGSNDTYNGKTTPTQNNTLTAWPQTFTMPPASSCVGKAYQSSWTFQTQGQNISPGIYCATGSIDFNASNLTGSGVTFVASSFQLNGSNESFTPASGENGLLFYQTGSSTLYIDGNTFVSLGTLYAPNAAVGFNSNGCPATISGFIEALDVTLTCSGLTINGTGPSSGQSGSYLSG